MLCSSVRHTREGSKGHGPYQPCAGVQLSYSGSMRSPPCSYWVHSLAGVLSTVQDLQTAAVLEIHRINTNLNVDAYNDQCGPKICLHDMFHGVDDAPMQESSNGCLRDVPVSDAMIRLLVHPQVLPWT